MTTKTLQLEITLLDDDLSSIEVVESIQVILNTSSLVQEGLAKPVEEIKVTKTVTVRNEQTL